MAGLPNLPLSSNYKVSNRDTEAPYFNSYEQPGVAGALRGSTPDTWVEGTCWVTLGKSLPALDLLLSKMRQLDEISVASG